MSAGVTMRRKKRPRSVCHCLLIDDKEPDGEDGGGAEYSEKRRGRLHLPLLSLR